MQIAVKARAEATGVILTKAARHLHMQARWHTPQLRQALRRARVRILGRLVLEGRKTWDAVEGHRRNQLTGSASSFKTHLGHGNSNASPSYDCGLCLDALEGVSRERECVEPDGNDGRR